MLLISALSRFLVTYLSLVHEAVEKKTTKDPIELKSILCKCGQILHQRCSLTLSSSPAAQKPSSSSRRGAVVPNIFSFFHLRLKITTGKLLMAHLPLCRAYMQAAGAALFAEISRACLMSSVLNILLMGATRPAPRPAVAMQR